MRTVLFASACLVVSCGRSAPTPTPVRNSAIDRLIDSARTAGIATAPLVATVEEGRLKHASDSLVLSAVRGQVRRETQQKP